MNHLTRFYYFIFANINYQFIKGGFARVTQLLYPSSMGTKMVKRKVQAFDGHFLLSSNWKIVLEKVVKFNRFGALLCFKWHFTISFSHQNIVKTIQLMQLLWVTVYNTLPNLNLRKVHNYNSLKLSSTTYHYTVIFAYMYFALSIRPLSEKVITFTILIFSYPRDTSN